MSLCMDSNGTDTIFGNCFQKDAQTLNRYVMASTKDHELVILMNAIATSCKLITSAVQRAGIAHLYGLAGEVNSTGDDQKKLDVLSNDMMINALVNSGVCAILVSEENEEPIIVPEGKKGKFCVAFDPLDGSSNIDCNVSVGTIFSVYEKREGSDGSAEDLLRSGADCICAGYVAYSSAVEMVFCFKNKPVHGFCLDPTIGEFVQLLLSFPFQTLFTNTFKCLVYSQSLLGTALKVYAVMSIRPTSRSLLADDSVWGIDFVSNQNKGKVCGITRTRLDEELVTP